MTVNWQTNSGHQNTHVDDDGDKRREARHRARGNQCFQGGGQKTRMCVAREVSDSEGSFSEIGSLSAS